MNATASATHHQQQRIRQIGSQCDSDQFFNLLTSPALYNTLEAHLPEHRERQFHPTKTLSLFLAQVMNSDRSCEHAVNRHAVNSVLGGSTPCGTHTGGYCRARQRLPLQLIQSLTRHLGESVDQDVPEKRQVDIVMEQHGSRRLSTDFMTGTRLGPKDHLIEIRKPKKCPDWMSEEQYQSAPERLILREFKAKHKIIVTTYTCPKKMPEADLAALYKSRWQVELDIRHIKDTLGMDVLSCQSPEMVIKEIWTYLLAYNLIRLLMAQSALMGDVLPRQLSFKHCLQLWLIASVRNALPDHDELRVVFRLMAQQRVGNLQGVLNHAPSNDDQSLIPY